MGEAKTTLSRRSFLKTAGAAGALAAAGGMTGCSNWLTSATPEAGKQERIAHTFHQNHCHGCCSLKCTARDGRLCLIEPNDWEHDEYRSVCLKGLSEVQHVYSPERIQTPMKRVGERGEGKFVAITWDEAAEEVKKNLLPLVEKYGGECVLIPPALEPISAMFTGKFLGAQTMGSKIGLDLGWGNGLANITGDTGALEVKSGWRDIVYSKTFLNFGGNPLESRLVHSKHFFEAKEAGCYTISIDPHFSTTASMSDKWIPIKPGTDAAVLLAMTTLTIENKWYDVDYMMAHTGFMFLINKATGKSLKSTPAEDAEDTADFKPVSMVWDTVSGMPQPFNAEGVEPALEGTFTYEGVQYATVFELLKETQAKYTAAWAEGVSGVPAADIYDMAKRYATQKPSAMNLGFGGPDKYANSDVVGHAAGILGALTGNFGVHGGGVGNIYPGKEPYGIGLGGWALPAEFQAAKVCDNVFDLPYKGGKTRVGLFFSGIFVLRHADFNAAVEWIKSLDYVIMTDINYSPDTAYADLVLPVCSKFECNEEIGAIRAKGGRVMLQEKVIDPLFESKTDLEIERFFAKILGTEQYLPATAEEWVRAQLEGAKGMNGATLESMIANNGIFEVLSEEPPLMYGDQKYKTPSGRIEPYVEYLLDYGQALPEYDTPDEVYDENPLIQKYPLAFAQPRTKFHIHAQFVDSQWMQMLFQPTVNMNPIDMAARGLEDGDVVEVFNDRGSYKCKVAATETVRPGAVTAIEGVWDKYLVEGCIQNVTNPAIKERGYLEPLGPVIAFNDTLVEVKKA